MSTSRKPVWSRWLLPGLLAILATLLALNIADLFASEWLSDWVTTQTDLSGRGNLAAGFAASVGLCAGLLSLWRGRVTGGWERMRWVVISGGCLAYALIDLVVDRPNGSLAFGLVLLAGLCFLLLRWQVRYNRAARVLLYLAALIVVANPAIDRYEVRVAGTPANYRFVSQNEPYQMTASAWNRLALARYAQEASEILLLIVVLKLILLDAKKMAPELARKGRLRGTTGQPRSS